MLGRRGIDEPKVEFEFEKVLGSGTTATVHLATMRPQPGSSARTVAVKIQYSLTDDEHRVFARNEHKLLASLKHDSIIATYGFFEYEWSTAIAMEYCECGSVQGYVRAQGPCTDVRVKSLGRQLLEGVNYMHRKRFVHRDLKPDNLLLKNNATVLKIVDFNSATKIGGGGILLTERGTKEYSAPELRFGRVHNEFVDIWASGLCLFFARRAELPFDIMSKPAARQLAAGQRPPINWGRDEPGAVDKLLRNLILQCLSVNLHDRPPAVELLAHPVFDGGFASKTADSLGECLPDPSVSVPWGRRWTTACNQEVDLSGEGAYEIDPLAPDGECFPSPSWGRRWTTAGNQKLERSGDGAGSASLDGSVPAKRSGSEQSSSSSEYELYYDDLAPSTPDRFVVANSEETPDAVPGRSAAVATDDFPQKMSPSNSGSRARRRFDVPLHLSGMVDGDEYAWGHRVERRDASKAWRDLAIHRFERTEKLGSLARV